MSARPDVAILLDYFGPGGVERVACHVANGLQRHGLKVEMIVLKDSGPVRSLLDPNITVRPLWTMPGLRHLRMKAAVPAIAAYLRLSRPRLFHSPGNYTTRPAALAIALSAYRGAFVAKITNPLLKDSMTARRKRQRRLSVYGWALRKAQVVLALAPSGVNEIAALDDRLAGRIRVIHNPYVDDRMLDSAGNRNPSDPPVILSLGRLTTQKNQALLLRAAARLRQQPWRLRICGTGPDEPALRALAEELGIADRLELPGFVDDPVPEYRAACVFVLSSNWEGLPATILEAVACGCPVVSTASSPGLVDLLREIGAHEAVARDDEEGLAEALRQALDGELPKVSSAASVPYGIEAACDEHAALFGELLDAHAGAAKPSVPAEPIVAGGAACPQRLRDPKAKTAVASSEYR
ncbi:MAG TPA: glycosyltransferase [Sphingomicrobium sp.]|nr:glycosyltransferase [Sphingomicrobium sp.]